MNKAQKYLINNNLADLVINTREKDYTKLFYVSDAMMDFEKKLMNCRNCKNSEYNESGLVCKYYETCIRYSETNKQSADNWEGR